MWEFFINNRNFSFLVIGALIGLGAYSLISIPKESSPEIQIPIGVVTTVLIGAPAVDIESLVTNEIERELSGSLENVKKITSTSQEGVSSVVVEFYAEADIDKSIRTLRDQIDSLTRELPSDAERPIVSEVNLVDEPIVSIAFSSDKTDLELSLLADSLEKELEDITGVSRVEKVGIRDREVSVLVNQTDLLRFDLTVTDIINQIRIANSVAPVGQIVSDGVFYNISFEGDIAKTEDVENIPVAVRGGQPVLVRDVAEVVDGLSPATTFSRLSVDNQPSENSFSLYIYKQRGGDITTLTDEINSRLTELQTTPLMENVSIHTIFDAGEQIKSDLSQLSKSGLQTIVLVIIILIVAIGWREGLIAGLAIPLSFTIGFIGLYVSGNTINFISLFALILGIGVLVDSGIVIVEGINKRMKTDSSITKLDAARLTIREFSAPLTAGTLTTVAMFTGLFVVSGVTGQFISAIPFTLIFVLFAALLVALGFLPLLSAVLLKRKNANAMEEAQVKQSAKFENWYRQKLSNTIYSSRAKKLFITLIFLGFISAVALIPMGYVKVVFFEQSDVDDIYVEVELAEGSTKESSDIAIRRVEEALYNYDDVIEAVSVTVGAGNVFGSGGQNEKLANVHITLSEDRDRKSSVIVKEISDDLKPINDAKVTVSQPSDGPPVGSPIGIKLLGDDIETLTQVGNEVVVLLSKIEGAINVKTSASSNGTEFLFTLDKEKTAAVGLNPQNVSQTLRAVVSGTDASSITTLDSDIDIVVRLNLTEDEFVDPQYANRTNVDKLLNIELATPTGVTVPLSSLVDASLQESSASIKHEDKQRIMTVSADITDGANVIEINSELEKQIEENITLPAGVSFSVGGEAEESNKAFIEMGFALIIGIVLMVGILVFQFDSFRHTFYVLSILPFSLIGILYGLAVTGSSLSFPSIMGFIALSGIIVNNSILLIDMMNRMRKDDPTKKIYEVAIDSAVSRLRPILLTSATTIMGMVPLLYADEIWVPLATAVMFGLAFSVVITLILIPVIYSKWPGEVRN
jgi:multidrug efflux pump subunit AcrB